MSNTDTKDTSNTTKVIKVTYTEQSKAVVTSTQIEYSGTSIPSKEEVLKESQEVFLEAQKFAAIQTMKKMR